MHLAERRVGDADQGGPRTAPAELDADDFTQEEFAAAVKAACAEADAALYERMQAIINSPRIKGRERKAIELALAAPDMSAQAVLDFIAGIPQVSRFPSLEERMSRYGAALSLGPPTGDTSRTSSEAVIERVNRRNGFGTSNENAVAPIVRFPIGEMSGDATETDQQTKWDHFQPKGSPK
jgi:hypothetical protein